ncbi:hypothetical protein L486_03449 [Kwoniella mangroviensis CBS 10435]|uniref:BZIP domain-containing protein n=1 Tax=Kwoniella mangroviensis CBS 10435 TaxID=1331196 RepID=A0A1B9ITU0_9TREE|nr:hypothetical protein L486_03449 [Kwoniella mangroviensis CBS 10435]
MTNAVASSSKRPAPSSSSSPSGNKAKKPRPSTSTVDEENDDEDDGEEITGDMDDEMKARIARKEARTIRNRESAQRSRNQRKAHLANLERRVIELEAENRALKGDSPASATTPTSAFREASPAQSVISLANDLGIPTELVNGTGVKLSNVAPPPADLGINDMEEDVKPVINHTPSPVHEIVQQQTVLPMSVENIEINQLKAENAALRERVSLLENLVKQVVAVANFSGLQSSSTSSQDIKPAVNTIVEQPSIEIISPTTSNNIDWASFISAPVVIPPPTTAGLDSTLSPPLYPSTLTDIASRPQSGTYGHSLNVNVVSNGSNPVARHPAEVATMSSASSFSQGVEDDKALQRARGNHSISSTNNTNTTTSTVITEERIRLVARLVIALAQQRGWITQSSTVATYPITCGMDKPKTYLGKMKSAR